MIDPATKDIIIFLIAFMLSCGLLYLMFVTRRDEKQLRIAMSKISDAVIAIEGHYMAVDNIRWLYDSGKITEGNARKLLMNELEKIHGQTIKLDEAIESVNGYSYLLDE